MNHKPLTQSEYLIDIQERIDDLFSFLTYFKTHGDLNGPFRDLDFQLKSLEYLRATFRGFIIGKYGDDKPESFYGT